MEINDLKKICVKIKDANHYFKLMKIADNYGYNIDVFQSFNKEFQHFAYVKSGSNYFFSAVKFNKGFKPKYITTEEFEQLLKEHNNE